MGNSLLYWSCSHLHHRNTGGLMICQTGRNGGGQLKRLKLSLCDLDKLTGDFPWLLPSLTKLSISRSLQLASAFARMSVMSKLKLGNCDNPIRVTGSHVVEAFGCLQHLKISYYSFPMTFSCCENVELVMHHSHKSLEQLYVHISCSSILSESSTLKGVKIWNSLNVVWTIYE